MNSKKIAEKYLPQILFCENEPFYPISIGYEIFQSTAYSNTFARPKKISINGDVSFCVEYQIYWHYDITHMFDLEHIWIYVDKDGAVIDAECSFHGYCNKALLADKSNLVDNNTVKLFSQPGKHAFASIKENFEMWTEFANATTLDVGKDGFSSNFYDNGKYKITPYIDKLVCEHMEQYKFTPSTNYVVYDLSQTPLMTWDELLASFNGMVDEILDEIINSKKHIVIFTDSGDTIIDESSEIHEGDSELVLSANVIPGADITTKTLHEKGYTIVIVADGLAQSFKNVFKQNDIEHCFHAMIYSECMKVCKPDARMFKAAMGAALLEEGDINRIIMVGNNLKRDILGANNLGITSVLIDWSTRYNMVPDCEEEVPDYTISKPNELVDLVEKLNDEFIATLLN